MNVKIQTEVQDTEVILLVEGEVDAFTAPQLKEKLLGLIQPTQYQTVSLDLAGVSYMDSTGVGVLIGALKASKQTGTKLLVKNIPPRIERLFTITGLIDVITVEPQKGEGEA